MKNSANTSQTQEDKDQGLNEDSLESLYLYFIHTHYSMGIFVRLREFLKIWRICHISNNGLHSFVWENAYKVFIFYNYIWVNLMKTCPVHSKYKKLFCIKSLF